jgi:hypothetical protein
MNNEQHYEPSHEEVAHAEESMTPEQKAGSEARAEMYPYREAVINAIHNDSITSQVLFKEILASDRTLFTENREVVIELVKKDSEALRYVSPELQNDREVVLAALLKNVDAYKYASKELQSDRSFVFEVVTHIAEHERESNHGYACDLLKRLSPEFYNDREIMFAAVLGSGPALKYASPELLHDRQFILDLAKHADLYWAWSHLAPEFQSDREIALAAVTNSGGIFRNLSPELQNDPELAVAALKENPYNTFMGASSALKGDRGFLLQALNVLRSKHDGGYFLKNIPQDLLNDRNFAIDAVQANGQALSAFKNFENDREVAELAVTNNPDAMRFVSSELKANREFVRMAVEKHGYVLAFASQELRNDPELQALAVRK